MRQKFNETTQNIKSASKNLHDITTKIALIFSYVWSHNFCIFVQYCQSLSDRQINFTDGTFRSIGELPFTVGQCFTDGNMSCNAGSG